MRKIYAEGFFSVPSDIDSDEFMNELYAWLQSRGCWFSGWTEVVEEQKG